MNTRRSFHRQVAAGLGALGLARVAGRAQSRYAIERCPTEFQFSSGKAYRDPFGDVEVDVVFRDPDGREYRVPAWWAGEQNWRVRFAPQRPGRHTWRTIATDTSNQDLHGRTGALEVTPYEGQNPLYRHGAIRVRADKRGFEHSDGTPFFWLGDTWWMGFCSRLSWPADFETLTVDRVRKGFNVVQIVAGLYPDMPQFDPRGANEAGFPWEKDYTRINPSYFDMADVRIARLVDSGIVPCIVGCWGYYYPILGDARIKRHWRNIVARWSALPVVWCLAGEGSMPYYLSKSREADAALQKHGWTEIGRYVRSIDAFHRPVTIHPSISARMTVDDPAVLDFDMLQTGHNDRKSIPNTITRVTDSYVQTPRMPVLVGEVCYEGIKEASRQEVQRFMFWSCVLSGTAGHTYGANGIWQVNRPGKPFGPSPHGVSWGNVPWQTAYQLPGSGQLGMAKKFLSRFEWWRFEPHPEWAEPHWSKENYLGAYAAGIPGQVRLVYLPDGVAAMTAIEPGTSYRATYFDPVTGEEHQIGPVTADGSGTWKPPNPPIFQDWVLVLQKTG